MVYVAAAAPQKFAVSQESKPSTKVEPSLFAPSVSTVKGTNQAARRQPVRVSKPRVSSPAEDWMMDLTVNRKPAENWEDAYHRYFKKHQVHPQTIRLRIRDLTEQKVPDLKQVIGLLRAALRAGQIQPWMYEALALAMRIEKMPEADIERVLLSSADFATSAGQIIFLAEYMDRLGYRKRALELLREASLRDPAADVAYAKALNIAIYLGDEAGLRWATLGVLSQDWVQENTAIFDKATRHAQAIIEQMRKSGRDQEADHYAAEIKEALRRDIVVKVSWNGDADVDLVVEEPSGSVCSYIQNKTPGGGLLLGEPDTKLTQPASGSHAEVYSCPEAFSGDYRVLLRKIWGRIPAGLVTVDVWSHLGTEKEKHIQKVIPLDDTRAMVSFQLDQGRRKEGLADQRLANDVVRPGSH